MEKLHEFSRYKQCVVCGRLLPLDCKENFCVGCEEGALFHEVKDYIRTHNVEEIMKRLCKQILSFVLIISLVVGIVLEGFPTVEVQAAVYGWDGTTKTEVYPLDNVYWISSPDELAWFAAEVNGGNKFTDKIIYITDYIDLNDKPWTPIGNQIDGEVIIENCSIQRMNCTKSIAGLFGQVTVKNLTIKNVIIEDAQIKGCDSTYETQKKGILAGYLQVSAGGMVYIEKVSISGSLDKQTGWAGSDLGGLFGTICFSGEDAIVCIDDARLSVEMNVSGGLDGSTLGGVVAFVEDSSHIGKLQISRVEIEDSINAKNTYGYNSMYAGGMIGYTNGGNYYIDQCSVKGSIYASSYAGWSGGIAAYPTYNTMQITNSSVSASVSANFTGWYGASHNGGGLLGYSASKDYNSSFISNCLVTGYIGSGCAFVAHANSDKDIQIANSVFDTQTTGLSSNDMYGISKYGETSTNSVSNSKGYMTSELQSASLYSRWDTTNTWKIEAGSYPQLYWLEDKETVYGAKDLENKDIIERVSEYTSDEFFAQYDAIMKLSCSDDKKYQLLTNLCVNYGLTDPKEGIEYLSNASDKRLSYVYLTSDELYMSYQLRNFLVNGGAKGSTLRGLIVVDGLVFNDELGKWMKPTTYIDKDFPWVDKYKNMLYSFMETGAELNIVKNDVNLFICDLAKNLSDVHKIRAENIIKEISEAKNLDEVGELIHSADMQQIYMECTYVKVGGTSKPVYTLCEDCGFGKLYKNLGMANKVVKLVDLSFDEFADFMILDSRLSVYQQYRTVLEEINSAEELDSNLRAAAEQILVEIDEGAYGKIKELCLDLVNYVDGNAKISSTVLKELWKELGVSGINDFLKLIDLAAFFSNMAIDMGKVVKYEAYVEGYAQLGSLYREKLEAAKSEFLNNRSEGNAWEFFRLYNLLYRLRVSGEEAYIEMLSLKSSVPLLKSYGINPKLDSVKQVVAKLKRYHQFTMDEAENVPLSCQFAVKTVIQCPVDVEIYAPDGTLITTLIDGKESDITNKYGRFAVVRDYAAEDYKKVICFNDKEDYKLKIIARDDGLETLEVTEQGSNNLYSISNLQMREGNLVDTSISGIISDNVVHLDINNDGVAEDIVNVNITDDEKLIESLSLKTEKIELVVGDSCLLEPIIIPADSSQQQVCWLSDNEEIVKVVDGKISALAKGTVNVNCVSVDNSSLVAVCTIIVKEKQKDTVSIENTEENGSIDSTEAFDNNTNGSSTSDIGESKTNSSVDTEKNTKEDSISVDEDNAVETQQPIAPEIELQLNSNYKKLKLIDIQEETPYTVYVKDKLKVSISAAGAKKIYYKVVKAGQKPSSIKYKLYKKTLTLKKSNKYKQIYFKIVDENGRIIERKTIEFLVDGTAPVVCGVKNGKLYRKKVKITFSDQSGIASARINGKKLKNGTVISKSGDYRVVVKDNAGNKRVIKFTIWLD